MRSSKNISLIGCALISLNFFQKHKQIKWISYKIFLYSSYGWSNLTSSSRCECEENRHAFQCVYVFSFHFIWAFCELFFFKFKLESCSWILFLSLEIIRNEKKNACAVKMTNGEIRMLYFWHFHQFTFFNQPLFIIALTIMNIFFMCTIETHTDDLYVTITDLTGAFFYSTTINKNLYSLYLDITNSILM